MIGSLHHIGIAVARLEDAVAKYRAMGFSSGPVKTVASEGVRLAFVESGGTRIELLESLTPDGVVAKFLARRGEGVHHIAFSTPDIRRAMAGFRAVGLAVIDAEPRRGHGGRLVAFVHPKSLHGLLFELVEE